MWWVQAILTGLGPSLAGGLVGLVLGTLRWPLVLALLEGNATLAAGTNLAVSTVAAAGGTTKHAREGRVDVALLVRLGGAAALVGAYVGAHFSGWLPVPTLKRAIGVVLLVSGAGLVTAQWS